ncbi:hypothetical protein OUZ56_021978 [Daphnia magna]|uniref:Uncharacterized protein n=1 Tax=Daphnia magna TaxID=35525 RepID=A0ABR0AV56_9CRUS|nr:hypothetical protein OUZ56_021978 [Daphnia magna]
MLRHFRIRGRVAALQSVDVFDATRMESSFENASDLQQRKKATLLFLLSLFTFEEGPEDPMLFVCLHPSSCDVTVRALLFSTFIAFRGPSGWVRNGDVEGLIVSSE